MSLCSSLSSLSLPSRVCLLFLPLSPLSLLQGVGAVVRVGSQPEAQRWAALVRSAGRRRRERQRAVGGPGPLSLLQARVGALESLVLSLAHQLGSPHAATLLSSSAPLLCLDDEYPRSQFSFPEFCLNI